MARTPHFIIRSEAIIALLLSALWISPVDAIDLTEQEARGKRIYLEGASDSGPTIIARVGAASNKLPAEVVPCGDCHGKDGQGKPGGDVVRPAVTWRYLIQHNGHRHGSGREHPAFDELSLQRAITVGVDPGGNRLDPSMPRYVMSFKDLADLTAYLKRLEFDLGAGLTDTQIRLGTFLPLEGRLANVGRAMKAIMEAYIDEVNKAGGIHGRQIELRVAEYVSERTQALWNARDLIHDGDVFALLSPFTAGLEQELTELVEEQQLLSVGPYTLFPADDIGMNRYSFYLLTGLRRQAHVLCEYVADHLKLKQPRIGVVYPRSAAYEDVAKGIRQQAKMRQWPEVVAAAYDLSMFDAEQSARTLHEHEIQVVFFFGLGSEFGRLARHAEAIGWRPYYMLPGVFSERAAVNVAVGVEERIFRSYPSLPADYTPKGRNAFEGLHERYGLDYRHSVAQMSAFTAATVLVEGLKRTGRDLSRRRLMAVLEEMDEFEPGLTPAITYNTTRRIGALGAYVVAADREGKAGTESQWIALDE